MLKNSISRKIGLVLFHNPFLPRKGGIPLATEMPAPVKATVYFAFLISFTADSSLAVSIHLNINNPAEDKPSAGSYFFVLFLQVFSNFLIYRNCSVFIKPDFEV